MMQRAGTAFYMAPEMINAGVYDQKAETWGIFSLILVGLKKIECCNTFLLLSIVYLKNRVDIHLSPLHWDGW